MKHYLKIYQTLLKLNFANLSAYKANFINSAISSVVWGGFSIASILLLTTRTSSIYNWSKEELLILTGAYNIMIGFFHMLFSRNFERFSRIIHLGRLDDILIKPVDSQFLLSFWMVNYTSVFRIILGTTVTVYLLLKYNMSFSIFSIFYFLILLFFGVALLYSIWFIVSTLIIWFTNLSNLVHLMYDVNAVTRFPQEMYKGLSEFVFLFLFPLTFIITSPVKTLLTKPNQFDGIILILLACIFVYISRSFWRFALRNYSSASS